jgi:uncharacterized phage protein (TIGR01671 family)
MREIRFRGRRVDNGEWVHGSLHTIQGDPYIIAKDTGHFSISHGEEIFITAYIEAVDPATVGQYTGLHDKAGREIWEGDIVHCRAGEIYHGISEYDAVFPVEYGWTQSMWEMQQCETIEVIGNIHENGDLLPKEA